MDASMPPNESGTDLARREQRNTAKLVFADGVFPSDITDHLAQLLRQHGGGAHKDSVEVVAIIAKNQRLEALPSDLPYLPSLAAHLVELDLSFNGLAYLPPALSCLVHLETLNLSHNAFEQVPPLVTSATPASRLRHLFLSGNRLSSLPHDFARLTRLENLFLGQNQFESVPEALYDLASLFSLSINHNRIRSLPAGPSADRSFGRLSGLKTLDLAYNELTELVLDIPSSLTSLDISANTLLSSLQLLVHWSSPPSANERRRSKLKRLDVSRCHLAGLPPCLAAFDKLASFHYADNPWNEAHAFMQTNPLPSAVLTWLRIKTGDHAGPMTLPADDITLDSEIEPAAQDCSLWSARMGGEECTVKVYHQDDAAAEAIAHEFSVLRSLYAARDDSPLLGIWPRPHHAPCLVFRRCTRSLHAHVKQELGFEERAQLAYHATEAVDAILTGVDTSVEDDSERAALLSLLYRDVQRSENWMLLDDGRLMLCGSTLPGDARRGSCVLLSPEMRRQERALTKRKGRRRDPLDIILGPDDDESSWRWTLPTLPSSSSASSSSSSSSPQPELVFALGLLVYEIFTGRKAADAESDDHRPRRLPIELPLAVRQMLQWTWEWEKEVTHKGTRRRAKGPQVADAGQQQQKPQPRRRAGRGERRPSVRDVMWLCFWMGHERTRIDDPKEGHSLSLRDFGPHLIGTMAKSEEHQENEEEMDEETRNNLVSLFGETARNVAEKAMPLRVVRKEQKREQLWQLSHSDLFSDSDDDEDSDDYGSSSDEGEGRDGSDVSNPLGGQAGIMQLQFMLANITNSFRELATSEP